MLLPQPPSSAEPPATRSLARATEADGTEQSPATDAGPALSSRLDFTTQDYLALGTHPVVRAAAFSVLGAAHPASLRADPTASALEDRLATFLQRPFAATFATGTQAIRLTLGALLQPGDEVIVDCAACPAMADAVLDARAHLHCSPTGSVAGVERRLARLARQPHRGRLFIAVPAISAHAARMADLAELSALSRAYKATLVVDATHDLGALGPSGRGVTEIGGGVAHDCVLVGSLAKTFAAKAGFAAFSDPALKTALDAARTDTPALSPVSASVILAAVGLISGPEGRRRRRKLHGLVLRLRNHLMADGIKVMGHPAPFVPILLPPDTALPRTALLQSAGPRVSLLQPPVVPSHAPRWRIHLSAAHGPADIDGLAELIRDVTRAFDRRAVRSGVIA
mgnify:CR=1 FL=1